MVNLVLFIDLQPLSFPVSLTGKTKGARLGLQFHYWLISTLLVFVLLFTILCISQDLRKIGIPAKIARIFPKKAQ